MKMFLLGEARMFDQFWKLYPRKVARFAAEKEWKRLKEDEKRAAIEALPIHAQGWADRDDKQFIPHASTWLHQRRWEDEIEVKKTFEQIAKERWEARK